MPIKHKDSKFIIYQVLYIFVITVLALKGADLDLSAVVQKDKVVEKSNYDSLKIILDSLYAAGINFDIKIREDDKLIENEALRNKLLQATQKLTSLTKQIELTPIEERLPEVTKLNPPPPVSEETEQTLGQMPFSIAQTFIQNTWNVAKNNGNTVTYIYDPANMSKPIVTIQPGDEKTFDLTDQSEVIVKFGSREEKVKVVPNRPPEIKIERATKRMEGSDIYVNDLQKITCFTVTIKDERPEQLKVLPSGPIDVKGPTKDSKGNLIFNVSLKLAGNETKFDEWADRNDQLREKDGRYKVNFFFNVIDQKTNQKVSVGDAFYFTEFSK